MAGIYVHIPFCTAKCAYCDFFSVPRLQLVENVVRAIGREWMLRKPEIERPETLYIGGGTPSLLSSESFTTLTEQLPALPLTEFTVEVNPDDVVADKAGAWLQAGVNRISMGVQSFCDDELNAVGRRHSAATAINAYRFLRNIGFNNLSLDLIYGLPGQTLRSWKYSVDTLLDLRPEHISAYLLSVEPGTRLFARKSVGKFTETDDDTVQQMYTYLCNATERAGYQHYEISNFALPGKRAVHNSSYWAFKPYVGLGPAAHSYGSDGLRRINPSNINAYLSAIESGQTAYTVEEETDTDRINDRIMVALRTSEGLDLSTLPPSVQDTLMASLRHIPPGYIIRGNDNIRIPENRFLVSDAIIRELFI